MGERATLRIIAGAERVSLDLHQASEAERLAIIAGVFALFGASNEERTARAYAEFFASVDGKEYHGAAPFKPLRLHDGYGLPADTTEWARQLQEKQKREVAAARDAIAAAYQVAATDAQPATIEAEPSDPRQACSRWNAPAQFTCRCEPGKCEDAEQPAERPTRDEKGRFVQGHPGARKAKERADKVQPPESVRETADSVSPDVKDVPDAVPPIGERVPTEKLLQLKAALESGRLAPSDGAGDKPAQQKPTAHPVTKRGNAPGEMTCTACGDKVNALARPHGLCGMCHQEGVTPQMTPEQRSEAKAGNLRALARRAYQARNEETKGEHANYRPDTWQPAPGFNDDSCRESEKESGVMLYKTRYWCPNVICGNKGKRYVRSTDTRTFCHACNTRIKLRPATAYTNPENGLPVRGSQGEYFRANEIDAQDE